MPTPALKDRAKVTPPLRGQEQAFLHRFSRDGSAPQEPVVTVEVTLLHKRTARWGRGGGGSLL